MAEQLSPWAIEGKKHPLKYSPKIAKELEKQGKLDEWAQNAANWAIEESARSIENGKWGRSSPTRCFARGQIDRRVVRNHLSIWHLLDRQGDREGDGYGDLCLSCTRHPFALQIAVEAL